MAEAEGKGAPYPFFSRKMPFSICWLEGLLRRHDLIGKQIKRHFLTSRSYTFFLRIVYFFLFLNAAASLSCLQIFYIRPSSSDFRFFLRYVALTENLVLLRTATWHVKEKASDTQRGARGNLSPLTFERLFDTVFLLFFGFVIISKRNKLSYIKMRQECRFSLKCINK